MEKRIHILVIGRHRAMMENVLPMLQSEGYAATGEFTNEAALATFERGQFDGVVIGGGVDEPSRRLFQAHFKRLRPQVKVLDASPGTILAALKDAFPTMPTSQPEAR